MAAIDENLLTKMTALLPPGTVVQQAVISEFTGQTRVWFRRASESNELHMDGSAGLTTSEFDVEIHSTDIDEAQSLAAAIKASSAKGGLDGFFGMIGDQQVVGVFVQDHDDTYAPKGLWADEGFHVPALKIKVIFDGG